MSEELKRLLKRYDDFEGDVGKPTMKKIIKLLLTERDGAPKIVGDEERQNTGR